MFDRLVSIVIGSSCQVSSRHTSVNMCSSICIHDLAMLTHKPFSCIRYASLSSLSKPVSYVIQYSSEFRLLKYDPATETGFFRRIVTEKYHRNIRTKYVVGTTH